MNSTQENHIFFISVPEIHEVVYFIGKIKSVISSNLTATHYAEQIRTTRSAILKNDQIIAAPVCWKFSDIHIIFSKKLPHDQLYDSVRKFDIILQGPHALTPKVYHDCIKYTLMTRISPEWNKVDKYLVKSSDFLYNSQSFDGLEFETNLTVDGQFTITAHAHKLKLPVTKLEYLGTCKKLLQSTGCAPAEGRVHLLPHLMPGKIVNVSKNLPNNCPFKNYAEIRTYWKDMYGYNLPPHTGDTLYAQVSLNRNGILYSYPLCCIRLNKVIKFKCEGSKNLANEFARSIVSKCASLCGKNIDIKLFVESFKGPDSLKPLTALGDSIVENQKNDMILEELENKKNQTDFKKKEKQQNAVKKRPTSPPVFFPKTEVRLVPQQPKSMESPKLFPIFKPMLEGSSHVYLRVPSPNKTAEPEMMLGEESEPENKKQKMSLDVENLARAKCLHKATISDLTKFCKDNAIPMKSKERKNNLMAKIYELFGISLDDAL